MSKYATIVVMFKTPLLLAAFCLLCASPAFARGSFVYVTNYDDGTVSQFRASPNGALTPLTPPCVKAYLRCHSLAADPEGRFLYVLSGLQWSRRKCLISQFRIGPDGRLTPLSPPRVPLAETPYLIAADPHRSFLSVLNYGGSISQFRIRKNGTLTLLSPPQAIGEGSFNYSVALDRRSSVFYETGQLRMTNEWLGGVSAFRTRKDGTLQVVRLQIPENGSLAIGKYAPFPPQQVVLSQQKHSAYILYQGFAPIAKSDAVPAENLEAIVAQYQALAKIGITLTGPKWGDLEAVLAQYRTQAGGGLRPLSPARVLFPGTPQEAVVDPQSRYCYIFIRPQYLDGYPVKADKIILARYAIRGDGTLGRCAQQTFTSTDFLFDPMSRAFNDDLFNPVFSPSGRTLYLLTRRGVSPYRVKPDGSIVPLPPRPIRAGFRPLGMVYVQK